MINSFQWLIALRYLRMQVARSAKIHWVTAVLALALVLVMGTSYALDHTNARWALDLRLNYAVALRIAKLAAIVTFVLVEVFILLVRRLTIFTTISTYGLFLGSGALVIVLSVMSGFEADLRHKIVGTNAHIVVSNAEQSVSDWATLRDKLVKMPDVVGATPYISNEVMVASASNLSGVLVKGIDPATVGQVTDLQKNLDVGELEYLSNPDKLRDDTAVPLIKRFHDEEPFGDVDKKPDNKVDKKVDGAKKDTPEPGAKKDTPEPTIKKEAPAIPTRRVLPGVIVGRELARNLRLYVGDDINVVSPLGGIGPSGPIPKSKPFRVAGIFFTGMFEYDSKYLYMSVPAAQKFLDLDEDVTGIELKVKDPDKTERAVDAIRATLGPGYEVKDWKEINRNLFSALKLEKIAMFIVLCFIILVAAFSIIANGIMLVVEKGREIAILKSMGASDGTIMVIFLILGLYMGLLGTGAGIAIGILACLGLSHFGVSLDPDVYYITQLPVRMNPYEIVIVFVAAIAIALLATVYPALVAAGLRPVEGLREGNH